MSGIHPYLSESTNNNNIEYYLNFLNDILTSAPKRWHHGVNTMSIKEDFWRWRSPYIKFGPIEKGL